MLYGELGATMPKACDEPGDIETKLAFGLTMHVLPEASAAEVAAALRVRAYLEVPELWVGDPGEQIDDEMLRDFVLEGDKQKIKDFEAALTHRSTQMQKKQATAKLVVEKHYETERAQRAQAPSTRPPTAAMRKAEFAKLKDNPTLWLQTHVPEGVAVCEDSSNGRWQLSFPPVWRKSVSWTGRGQNVAVKLVLQVAWDEAVRRGMAPPPPLVAAMMK